jgi:multiple sugar transport system substrate-binding protein
MNCFFCLFILTCQKNQPTQTELTFWAMGAEGEQIEKLLPEFEEKYPDIKVSVQSIPWSLAHEKLLTAFAGNSNPDVCQLGNTWIPEFQAIDALLELDSLVSRSNTVEKESYFQGVWDTNVLGKRIWGIPWYVDTKLLFYRTDILDEVGYRQPPRTWKEWLEASHKIKNLAHRKYAVFFSLLFNDFFIPLILVINNDGKFLKENDCYGAFDDPATLEAFRYYLSFFEQGLATRSMTEFPNIYQGFAEGNFSMTVTGPWNVGAIRRRTPELSGKWSTAVMPVKKNGLSLAGGASLVIFKNSKHPEAAWKWIEFLSQPETQLEFFRLTKDLPAVLPAWEYPEIKSDREVVAFYEQLQNVVPTPKIAEWEQIAVKMQAHLYRVIFKQVTLEEAVAQLNRDVDRILEKRRWLLSKGLLLTDAN